MNCNLYVTNRLVSLFWDRLVEVPSSTRGLSRSLLITLNYCVREATENHSKYVVHPVKWIHYIMVILCLFVEHENINAIQMMTAAQHTNLIPLLPLTCESRSRQQRWSAGRLTHPGVSVTPTTTGRVDGHGEKARAMRGKNQDVVCFLVVTKPTLMFDDLMVSPTDHCCMDTYRACAAVLRDSNLCTLRHNVHNGCIERCTVHVYMISY